MTRNPWEGFRLRQKKVTKATYIYITCYIHIAREWKSNDPRAIYVHISCIITPASTFLGTPAVARLAEPLGFTPSTRDYLCALILPFHRISLTQPRMTVITHCLNTHVSDAKRGDSAGGGSTCSSTNLALTRHTASLSCVCVRRERRGGERRRSLSDQNDSRKKLSVRGRRKEAGRTGESSRKVISIRAPPQKFDLTLDGETYLTSPRTIREYLRHLPFSISLFLSLLLSLLPCPNVLPRSFLTI